MCGRYTLRCADESELLGAFPFAEISETRIRFRPRYNIAPGQSNPLLHLREGRPVLEEGLWGFSRRGGGVVVNARSESAAKTAMFRDAFGEGRCLVPADGFFEWRREGSVNQPYLFENADGGLFLMAGLWERGRSIFQRFDRSRYEPDNSRVLLPRNRDAGPLSCVPAAYCASCGPCDRNRAIH